MSLTVCTYVKKQTNKQTNNRGKEKHWLSARVKKNRIVVKENYVDSRLRHEKTHHTRFLKVVQV